MVRLGLTYPSGRATEITTARLLRADAGIRYKYAVHEMLDVGETPAAMSNIVIRHDGYLDARALVAKEQRNLAIAQEHANGEVGHYHHCIMRAAFTLEQYPTVLEMAERLIRCRDTSQRVRAEACAYGGAAALSVGDEFLLSAFLEHARRFEPDNPDTALLELIVSGLRYQGITSAVDGPGPYFRPPVFFHEPGTADQLVNFMMSWVRSGNTTSIGGA